MPPNMRVLDRELGVVAVLSSHLYQCVWFLDHWMVRADDCLHNSQSSADAFGCLLAHVY